MGNCCCKCSCFDFGGTEGNTTNNTVGEVTAPASANHRSMTETPPAGTTSSTKPGNVDAARHDAYALAPSPGVAKAFGNDELDHTRITLQTKTKSDSSSLADEPDRIALQSTRGVMTQRKSATVTLQPSRRSRSGGGDTVHASGHLPILKEDLIPTHLSAAEPHSAPPGGEVNLSRPGLSGGGSFMDNNKFDMTVLLTNAEPTPISPKEDEDLQVLRKKCTQFRILVIGKANAGKTTMLQKMCNTTEAPVIRDRKGHRLRQSVINPTDGRGIHDINNELTFSSNKGFVFHDSPGFEAGSTKELENVQEFIAKRARANKLKEQLHAIWFCIPTDNDHPLTDAEIAFFKQGTGRVPVIAIFTKYDGMILKEYNRLRFEMQCTKSEANKQAPICADELFMQSEHYIKRVQETAYPPARYLRVQGMHLPGSTCAELTKQTVDALDSQRLQLLFVSVQQVNIDLCTQYALKKYIFDGE